MFDTEWQWKKVFIDCCALWEGRTGAPFHVAHRNGHYGQYLNSAVVAGNPSIIDAACKELIDRLMTMSLCGTIKQVIALNPESHVLAFEFARQVNCKVRGGTQCHVSCIARDDNGNLEVNGPQPKKGDRVILIANVITDESELLGAIQELTRRNISVFRVTALMNLLPHKKVSDHEIVALVNDPAIVYPGTCPMCSAGSKALVPGEPDFWKTLTSEHT